MTIVGGGIAGVEALLALRALARDQLAVELVAATPELVYRPLAVAEPFGIGEARRFALTRIVADQGARLHVATLQTVEPAAHRFRTVDGRSFEYDVLLVALGGRPVLAVPGSVTLTGPGYTGRFRTVLRELTERRIRRVAFAVPLGVGWALPLYELALMMAARVRASGLRRVALTFVTHESSPLGMLGPTASSTVRKLLSDHGIELLTDRAPIEVHEGSLMTVPGPPLEVDRVVSMPRILGPDIEGLPADDDGFIPVDAHGRATGVRDVYAAGDATAFPIKQGGLATQQADAAAEAIAAAAGLEIDPRPFRPVLRGVLLTGAAPLYFAAEISGGRGERCELSEMPLLWPADKVVGHYLGPYLRSLEPTMPRAGSPSASGAAEEHAR